MNALTTNLLLAYQQVRAASIAMCAPLVPDDFGAQPTEFVSPPKWNIAHTTWFFEEFILKNFVPTYTLYDPHYSRLFNSYYEAVGKRVARHSRAILTRPALTEVYAYRTYVDKAMEELLNHSNLSPAIEELVKLGLNHEQQHQELFFSEIKFILGHNPLYPKYKDQALCTTYNEKSDDWILLFEGLYDIGFEGHDFSFDNELPRHKVYLQNSKIANQLVTNGEYLEFILDGGYTDFRHWHSEGWAWVQKNEASAPLYWQQENEQWLIYTLAGLHPIDLTQQVTHINYFEAAAYAQWKGKRLPTEFEWEAVADQLNWGSRWEWTESAYLPYPGFAKAKGAVGEYNGKFMVNQKVLRGSSVATPQGHERKTYRNFWSTDTSFQFTGIRLAEYI